ncbi:hypothetical protein ACIBI8_17850 [Streptomyces sp. NPDC050529]|uniref:hypothetical protein n=1 Tax=Streptomyces sp. NPDC050529 TaxID=3365624 RepID=UPI0037A4CB55
MRVRDSDTAKADVKRTSSRILEILDVKGKVTKPGAITIPCSGYDSTEEVYRARHPWAIYNAPFNDMQKGVDRLLAEFQKDGWNIVKDGVDRSQGKSRQIIAESDGGEFGVEVRLHKASKIDGSPPMLEVTVESRCYRSPVTPTASDG